MGYILSQDQKELQQSVKKFMEKEIKPYVSEVDESGRFPLELYEKAFEMGLHCLGIPEEYGGGGLDLLTELILVEEISKVDAGIADSLGGNALAFQVLNLAGTDSQKKLFAERVIPGGFAAFALTEANAGSDSAATRTAATREGDEYVITGTKCFITNGGVANIYIVFAKTDKEKGTKGISAFLVERERPGLSVGKEENKMGIRASNTCEVVFDHVRIPADHLIGTEGSGFKYAMQALDAGRLAVSAMAIGIAQHALEEAAAYAKTRVTFGQPISKFQAIQFMLADMDMKIESARQMMVHAATLAAEGISYTREAAMAKCISSDAAVDVATDAIQVLGGYGYSREYPVEKLLRDAKIFQIFEGTNQIQRVIISGRLLGS